MNELDSGDAPRQNKDSGEQSSEPRASTSNLGNDTKARRPARGAEPFEKWERDEMEKLLNELNGHLGEFDAMLIASR